MRDDWRLAGEPMAVIFARYWRTEWLSILLLVAITVLASLSFVAGPYLFSRQIDRLSDPSVSIIGGFLLYALVMALSTAMQNSVMYLAASQGQALGFIVRTAFFDRLLTKTGAFFVEHNPAQIQQAGTGGERALNNISTTLLGGFVPGALQIGVTLAMLGATISEELILVALFYGCIFICLRFYTSKIAARHIETAMKASQENAKFTGNAINAMETLRHFRSERWMNARFVEKEAISRDGWRKFFGTEALGGAASAAALGLQLGVTFLLLVPRLETGELSTGDLVLFNMLLLQLNSPFEMIGRAVSTLMESKARFGPFAAMWHAEDEADAGQSAKFAPSEGRLTFDGVGFSYGGSRGVEGLSFQAERGRITYLVGPTGAGKSTAFKLVLKSIDPIKGRIDVDGQDLADISRADWFAKVGVVPQDIVMLNESLATNIALGRPLDHDRLVAAARKAAILDFIEALPAGFDTSVGERGLKLSGGERQRIAIARALYDEPEFLFLDEASSALDEATERDIMAHIREVCGQVTVIAITHRKSVIGAEDQVIRLKKRRAAEDAASKGELVTAG
ncbi:ATM1-type heavy metal exporter [Ensifer sp. M14]|uniref:ABC transporter ATP-binding protein n=1 Tax=Ensifer sp. M14 TaxID=2203782 RepID=UPI000E2BEF7C|nr:ABC transporter ATP-binding protein [Ensifer sp. M14]RDL52506.1 ATM1-type heavy metal exporter [Ensifer sp. M14]